MLKKPVLFIIANAMILLCSCRTNEPAIMVQKEINTGWTFRQVGEEKWLPAEVPGCVHTDLMANGIIEDPFYRLNEHDVQWIDKTDWEYKTIFHVDDNMLGCDRIQLDFKGIDTYAEIFVNGKQLFQADNMFREWQADLKDLIKAGENELHIILRSPILKGIEKYDAQGFVIPVSDNDLAEIGEVEGNKKVSVYTRKAGYHFGWDWGPRLVTSGIWRPVYLVAWNGARIENMQLKQNQLNEHEASLTAVFEVEANAATEATISIENEGVELAKTSIKLIKGISTYPVDFKIENPKLWWTNGLGAANLYTIRGKLAVGKRITEKSERIGLRTLELVRDQSEKGTSFYFKLNGVPVFMKGANYIPNDIFLPRVSRENYKKVVKTAQISNMNMLRIWGGGIYENDEFYDLCDEAGILIWQDFMFACAMFPGDQAFLDNVKAEAVDNIKRLRNHPCIALWCGNNEILGAWYQWGWKRTAEAKSKDDADKIWKAYEDIFHQVLPEAVKTHDASRSYWSSSPSSGTGIVADMVNGDEHYWGVWWGKEPFTTYATHIARFMSEYGFQSFPELKTVRQYALPEDYQIDSRVMNSHQRSSIGNKTIEYYMLQEYRQPKDFESFLYVNHVLQAEGIKFALEGHRRAMPYCMGSLYWQINDCWPVASWSSTDYYQRWKALQYYVKKGFEPVLVSPYTDGQQFKVDIVNDHLNEVNGKLVLGIMDFDGKVLWEKDEQVKIPANSSRDYFKVIMKEFEPLKDTHNLLFYTKLIQHGKVVSQNSFFFRPFKELNIPSPKVEYTIEKADSGFNIRLVTDKLAKNVYLQIEDEEGFFSDNYFDMLPGEEVVILLETNMSEEKLKKVLSIRTLYDAF